MKHTRALIVLALALLAGLVSVTLAARWMSGQKTPGAHIAVAARETIPATALALGVVGMGLVPASLGHISEAATTAISQLPAVLTAMAIRGGLG